MKLLLDMNVTQRWAPALAAQGHEVVHWRDVGDRRARDSEIMAYALQHGFVVLTHDLDFGDLLAATGDSGPSVVQIRADNLSADLAAGPVLQALAATSMALEQGALVSVDLKKARVRLLPLRVD